MTDVEVATHEDEEQRAGRTMDWIGARVSSRATKWVEMVESQADQEGGPWKSRTPWWEEVKRCVEGDVVPNKLEGWNHPVAGTFTESSIYGRLILFDCPSYICRLDDGCEPFTGFTEPTCTPIRPTTMGR